MPSRAFRREIRGKRMYTIITTKYIEIKCANNNFMLKYLALDGLLHGIMSKMKIFVHYTRLKCV